MSTPDPYLTDLPSLVHNGFTAACGLGEGWVPFTYETESTQGVGLAAGAASGAGELVLTLDLDGPHTLLLAIGPKTALRVWLDGDEGFREFVSQHGGRGLQECKLHHADLTGKRLHIAPVDSARPHPAFLVYIRAVAGSTPHRNARNLVATNDGFSWVALDGIESERDVWKFFTPLRDSDFGLMLWGPGGADFSVCHQTEAGTGCELDATNSFRDIDRVHAQNISAFFQQGGDILRIAVQAARATDIKIHFYIRVEAFGAPFPRNGIRQSQFHIDHPELRCRDEFGDEIMRLSYAYPAVQDHMIEYFRELLEYSPDGLCFAFNRSLPMMICEAPVLQEFERLHGRRPVLPDEADSDEMAAARASLLSEYLRRVRSLLDERGLHFSCIVPPNMASNRIYGLDLMALADEKIFDCIMVHNGGFHAGVAAIWDDPQWQALRDKANVYLNGWGGSWEHADIARFLKETVFGKGFAGGFFWDTENYMENPYNWHVIRKGGTMDFLDGVLSGEISPPVLTNLTRLEGMKLGRYDPGRSY